MPRRRFIAAISSAIALTLIALCFCVTHLKMLGYCPECGAIISSSAWRLFDCFDSPVTVYSSQSAPRDTGLSLFLGRCASPCHMTIIGGTGEGLLFKAYYSGRRMSIGSNDNELLCEFLKSRERNGDPGLKDKLHRCLHGEESPELDAFKKPLGEDFEKCKQGRLR